MGKNKMKVNKKYHLLVGGILSFLVLSLCLVSFFYTPYPPNEMNLSDKFISPGDSGKYLLGTITLAEIF